MSAPSCAVASNRLSVVHPDPILSRLFEFGVSNAFAQIAKAQRTAAHALENRLYSKKDSFPLAHQFAANHQLDPLKDRTEMNRWKQTVTRWVRNMDGILDERQWSSENLDPEICDSSSVQHLLIIQERLLNELSLKELAGAVGNTRTKTLQELILNPTLDPQIATQYLRYSGPNYSPDQVTRFISVAVSKSHRGVISALLDFANQASQSWTSQQEKFFIETLGASIGFRWKETYVKIQNSLIPTRLHPKTHRFCNWLLNYACPKDALRFLFPSEDKVSKVEVILLRSLSQERIQFLFCRLVELPQQPTHLISLLLSVDFISSIDSQKLRQIFLNTLGVRLLCYIKKEKLPLQAMATIAKELSKRALVPTWNQMIAYFTL